MGGNLTLGAAQGVTADIKTKGKQTLAQAINVLGSQPGTEWVKTLSNRNDVAWNQVQDAYTSWSHTEKHLNPVVGAVIAVADAAVTSGTGLASWAGNALASTTQNALGQSVLYGMGSSGMSALVSKAAVSLVDNQGDLSKTFKDLGSKDSVKSLASSIITGGALAGLDNVLNLPVTAQSSKLPVLSNGDWAKITGRVVGQSIITSGVHTGIYGGSFKDKLGNALLSNIGSELHAEGANLIGDYSSQLGVSGKLFSHAAVAAITAEIGRGNGKGAAAGAFAAELAALSLGDGYIAKPKHYDMVVKLSDAIGAVAGALATGKPEGVNSGAQAGKVVIDYNFLVHTGANQLSLDFSNGMRESAEVTEYVVNQAKQKGFTEDQLAVSLVVAGVMVKPTMTQETKAFIDSMLSLVPAYGTYYGFRQALLSDDKMDLIYAVFPVMKSVVNAASTLSNVVDKTTNKETMGIVGNLEPGNPASISIVRHGDRLVLNQGKLPTCGPNSCAMVMDTAGLKYDLGKLITQSGVTEKGTTLGRLSNTLNQSGLSSQRVSGVTIESLSEATAKGNPAIVRMSLDRGEHAVVVDGITIRNGQSVVAIRDPALGRQYFTPVSEFKQKFSGEAIFTNGVKK